ncbi:MAG TPA: hypothetical protein VMQ51_13970 [Candidatus Binatia bacterium]|nr:hypothetical protein [Candidatus Binatia bacterium]
MRPKVKVRLLELIGWEIEMSCRNAWGYLSGLDDAVKRSFTSAFRP